MSDSKHVTTETRVYADGAAKRNGRPDCVAGYGVYFPTEEEGKYHGRVRTFPSNQRAELVAVQTALEVMERKGIRRAVIVTDSMYTISCLTKWWPSWRDNAWTTAKGTPVKHVDVIRDCVSRLEKVHVRFQHIRSHQPQPHLASLREDWEGNREADRLATLALERGDRSMSASHSER